MDERERHREGMAVRRKVLGNAHVDRAEAKKTAFTAEFQDLITRYAWGEIWTRPAFDRKTRSALGHWDEFQMHVRAALTAEEGRLTPDEVKEVLMQGAIYCGVPVANHGFKLAEEIFAELGRPAEPSSPTVV